MVEVKNMTEETKTKNVFGTLWINKDAKGNTIINGVVGEKEVYGYINDVTIKNGKRAGQKAQNIKLYEKSKALKQDKL